MKLFHHLTLTLLTAVLLNGTALADEGRKAFVFYYDLSDQFISNMKKQIDEAAESAGLTLTEYNAGGDVMTQKSQLQAATSDKNAPLLVNLVDPRKAPEVIDIARKNNRRVIFFNRQPNQKVIEGYKYVWYVGADPVLAGDYQADLIVDYLREHKDVDQNLDGTINMILLKGENTHQETAYRTNAVLRILDRSHIKYSIEYESNTDWSFRQGYEQTNIALSQVDIDDIELIVANNDALALGAVSALKERGYNKGNEDRYIPVFGIDAIPQALKAISEGSLAGTVINDADAMAKTIVALAVSKEYQTKRLSKEIGYIVNRNHTINIPYAKVTK